MNIGSIPAVFAPYQTSIDNIVGVLDKSGRVDDLSDWMIHVIAERIWLLINADGPKQDCFQSRFVIDEHHLDTVIDEIADQIKLFMT